MACYLIPNTDTNSLLHAEVLSYFNGNEKKAQEFYAMTQTPAFLKRFGDWTEKAYATDDSYTVDGDLISRTNRYGEPALFENEFNRKYIKLRDGSKYFLDKTLLNYSGAQVKSLTSMAIRYLLDDDPTSITDVQYLDLSKLDNNDDGTNDAYKILEGDEQSLQDLKELVKQELGVESFQVNDREDYTEVTPEDPEAAQNQDMLSLIPREQKNSKDNANVNIKYLLSFIPKFKVNQEGVVAFDTVEFEVDGKTQPFFVYNDFNEVWTAFEESLAGLYPSTTTGQVKDLFQEMVEKLKQDYGRNSGSFNPTVMYAVNELISNLPEYKQNMFVQAFMKSKLNYYTVALSKANGKLSLKYFSSASSTSRVSQILKELTEGIVRSDLFNRSARKYNQDKAIKLNARFEKIRNRVDALSLEEIEEKQDEIINTITNLYRSLNLPVDDDTMYNFISSYNSTVADGGMKQDMVAALDDMKYLFRKLADTTTEDVYVNNKLISPIATEDTVFRKIANIEAKTRKDISENTVLGPENKTYWLYSLPNYLHIKLDRLKTIFNGDLIGLYNEMGAKAYYTNSYWRNKFIEEFEQTGDINFDFAQFLNLTSEDDQGDGGVSNSDITFADQLAESYNKAVLSRKRGGYSEDFNYFNTLTPADKSRLQVIRTAFMATVALQVTKNGYNFSDEVLDIYRGYFKDEYMSMAEVYADITAPDNSNLFQYYHFDKQGRLFDDNGMPVGNGFKFTLFQEFNPDNPNFLKWMEEFNIQGQNMFYMDEEEGLYGKYEPRYSVDQLEELVNSEKFTAYLRQKLGRTVDNSIAKLQEYNLINADGTQNNLIDEGIYQYYLANSNSPAEATTKFVAESAINQHIANIEFTKLFAGNPAFYKNLEDFSKRVPGTYTDGIYPNLLPGDDLTYTMAVIPDIKKPTDLYPQGVDVTDAQGWVTMERWEFLQRRLNKWTPAHQKAVDNIKRDAYTQEDLKVITAQPMKGVYFDMKDGVPTYVKYSQYVLIPGALGNTELEELYNKMKAEGIDEAVAFSGIKVGAGRLSTLPENKFSADMTLQTMELNNASWKLQQDLPSKGLKDTLIGSQVQKVILANLDSEQDAAVLESINSIVGELSDIGIQNLKDSLGLNPDGTITNRSNFYKKIIQELERTGNNPVAVELLKREFPLNYIFTNRSKLQSIITSMINNETVKIKSNGGSFIQASSFGWTLEEAEAAGVKMLVDQKELHPPKEVDGKVLPGQVFIPYSLIAKHIPNYKELPMADLNALIDDRLKTIIAYRIPTQDLASVDAMEIAGILPEYMGDVVIPYADITAKTGSDFDIDKLYLMVPEMEAVTSKGKTTLKFYEGDDKKGLTNQLILEYIKILTDPKNFGRLTTSIDSNRLKNHIKKHNPGDSNDGFDFFTAEYQLTKKFENFAGKSGVGIVANHITDHAWTQQAGMTMNADLGVGHFDGDVTRFDQVYSAEAEPDVKGAKKQLKEAMAKMGIKNIDKTLNKVESGDVYMEVPEGPNTLNTINEDTLTDVEEDVLLKDVYKNEKGLGQDALPAEDIHESIMMNYQNYLELINCIK